VASLDFHQDVVVSVCFSADGGLLASASLDRSCALWDARSFEFVASLGHPDQVLHVQFDRHRLVTCCYDNTIRFYDQDSLELLEEEMRGGRAAFGRERAAVSEDKVVKMVRNGKVAWASKNYPLSLKNANIENIKGLSDLNRNIWEQHNP